MQCFVFFGAEGAMKVQERRDFEDLDLVETSTWWSKGLLGRTNLTLKVLNNFFHKPIAWTIGVL